MSTPQSSVSAAAEEEEHICNAEHSSSHAVATAVQPALNNETTSFGPSSADSAAVSASGEHDSLIPHSSSSASSSTLPSAIAVYSSWLAKHFTRTSADLITLGHTILPQSWKRLLYRIYLRVRRLPITEFYLYMLRIDPKLFSQTLFINYGLPILIETLPWYLSRRKLSSELRDSRNSIQHQLLLGSRYDSHSVMSFVVLSCIYAVLYTIEQTLRTRVMMANRLVVKRLVMERILYSEIGSLQQKYLETFGEEVRTDQLEQRVFSDISETLTLFNNTIPSIIRGSYSFTLQSIELYSQRHTIDILSILRPSIVGLITEFINWLREKYLIEQQTIAIQKNTIHMSRVVSNIVDGLSEIQVNNMQGYQLRRLDTVIDEEIDTQQGVISAVNSVWRILQNRSVLDFTTEVYIVHTVMQRRGITHEQYRKIQNDIDYVTRLFHRIYNLGKDAYRILDTQQRVIALINLPSFIHEAKLAQSKRQHMQRLLRNRKHSADINELNFKTLRVRKLQFRYKDNLPLALNIASTISSSPIHNANDTSSASTMFDGEVKFERGKTYLVVGQNRSGKSTLVQILCKLYHAEPDSSDITFNDQPFDSLPRTELRNCISYIAQRPFIFPATIEENIRIGNNTASVEDVERAAEAAGVFLADKPKPLAIDDAQKLSLVGSDGNSMAGPVKPWEQSRIRDVLTTAGSYIYNLAQYVMHPEASDPYQHANDEQQIPTATVLPSTLPAEEWQMKPLVDQLNRKQSTVTASGLTDSTGSDITSPYATTLTTGDAEADAMTALAAELPINVHSIHPVLAMETAERGSNLSGGFAQSVALARVFLRTDAQLVILDESMGQMDAIKKRQHIIPRLFDFVHQNNMTLVLISHDIQAVCEYVDEIYVMERGKVVQHGSHQQLLAAKAEPYCRLAGVT